MSKHPKHHHQTSPEMTGIPRELRRAVRIKLPRKLKKRMKHYTPFASIHAQIRREMIDDRPLFIAIDSPGGFLF